MNGDSYSSRGKLIEVLALHRVASLTLSLQTGVGVDEIIL